MVQLRHLHYFVKIVEAGSFSRAAASIHVAQPALSQQIADLELQLGVNLLMRNARGVRPTPEGEALYREAASILRQMEQLPSKIRSSYGEIEGSVGLGMSSTLAAALAGHFMETCKAAYPRITLKFAVADSETIKSRIEAQSLDMGIVFEDELVPAFSRKPLYRQRLYVISRELIAGSEASVSLNRLAQLPLILPSLPNVLRSILERAFASAKLTPNIIAEADVLSSIMSGVKTGIGKTVLPKGDISDIAGEELARPVLLEPPLYLTASIVSSGDFPLTRAGEAVRNVLGQFARDRLRGTQPGAEWIDWQT